MTAPAPLLDAHVHFWDPGVLHYPWLSSLPALRRAFGPAEYAAATARVPVAEMLFVECNPRPDDAAREVAHVEALAREDPRIAGIVAFVDLTDAAGWAAALDERAAHPMVRGIRHNIQGNPPGFALQPSFVAGVTAAGGRGLAFDLCVTHDQLGEAEALVRRAPGTRFVLDHCGKPPIRDGLLDPWRGDIARIAAHPNVWCKLSGLLTEAGAGWRDEDLAPYLDHVVECFGTDRLVYGGDWPVVTLAAPLAEWFEFTERYTRGWSDDERAALYCDTARRVYRPTVPSAR